MTRRRSRPRARPPGRSGAHFETPTPPEGESRGLRQALEPVHLGQPPHGPRPRLLDRRRLRALPPRPRRRGPVRVRLRRLRAAGRAGGDRARGAAGRLGRALRRADARADPQRLGFSFDYDRVFYSSDEGQYRWSQWLFLTLLEAGLIYRDDATVDWCDTCQTTLAALQVEDGRCWRCHNPVRLIRRPTWFLRITAYVEENDANTRASSRTGTSSRSRPSATSSGASTGSSSTSGRRRRRPHRLHPAPDAIGRGRDLRAALAPPPRLEAWAGGDGVREQLDELRSGGWERSARDASAVPVIDTGASVTGPGRRRAAGADLAAGRRPLRADGGARDPRGRRGRRRARRARRRGSGERRTGRGRRRLRRAARRAATAPATSRSRASAPGGPRSRSSTARPAASSRSRSTTCRCSCRATSSRPARATRWPSARTSSTSTARAAVGPPSARPTPSTATSTPSGSGSRPAVPPEARAEQMFTHPDLQRWLPVGAARRRRRQRRLRLRPAGRDQGAARHRPVRLHGRRRAVRGLPLPRDGRRRRPQDEQAPRQRRRSRRAGRRARRRHRPGRDALRRRPGEGPELDRRRDPLRIALPVEDLGLHPRPDRGRRRGARRPGGRRRHGVHPRPPREMVRQRDRADHRRLRGATDAQGGPRREQAVRADRGLREADREAARAALAGRTSRPCSRRSRCSPGFSRHLPRTSPRSC